ncbi:MAG: ATP-binding cassette domain-containing protein [Anaerolineae bacterium]
MASENGNPVILSMRHINKRFPGVVALDDVSFDVHAGEVHCLIGENGAGKSTLMNIMSGTYTEFEGEMLLNERFGRVPQHARRAGRRYRRDPLSGTEPRPGTDRIREHLSGARAKDAGRHAQTWAMLAGEPDDAARSRHRHQPAESASYGSGSSSSSRSTGAAEAEREDHIIMDEPTSALSDAKVSTCSA